MDTLRVPSPWASSQLTVWVRMEYLAPAGTMTMLGSAAHTAEPSPAGVNTPGLRARTCSTLAQSGEWVSTYSWPRL